MASRTLKINDRVKRAAGQGCYGIVKEIRQEVTASTHDYSEKGLMFNVLWDNGTLSYLSAEALSLIEE